MSPLGAILLAKLRITGHSIAAVRDESKLKDLSNFCVSEDYADLREQLGLAAVTPA